MRRSNEPDQAGPARGERVVVRCLAAAIVLAMVLVSGCRIDREPADLVIINGQDPETLDPALATSVEDLRIIMSLFEGLTRLDPTTARPVPGLAESWDISPDGTVYRFHLRTNLVWSTGDPLTADDVVYSWRRVLDPRTAADYAGQLYFVRNAEDYNRGRIDDPEAIGVRALDSRTVEVVLRSPTPFFLDLCAFQTLAVVPRRVIEEAGDRWLRERPLPVSGPYELVSWRLNDRVRLRRNPKYWDAANTRTEVVDLLPVGAPHTALNLYERRVADVIWDKNVLPAELVPLLAERTDFHRFHYLATYFLRFNTTRAPLDRPRVRKALTLGIDKRRLVEKILRGGEPVAAHLVPPGIPGYQSPEGPGYDPEAAGRLLEEAGFPGGKGLRPLQYLFDGGAGGSGRVHEKVAVEIQAMWERLGVTLELRRMEKKVYLAAQTALDYDVSRSSWIGDYNDPTTFLDLFTSWNGNNRTGWSHPEYDRRLRESYAEQDEARRFDTLSIAEEILVVDELPIVPVFFYVGMNLYRPDEIGGIHPNLLDVHPVRAIWKRSDQ